MNLGVPELLVLSLWIVPFGLGLWGLVDSNRHSLDVWEAAGKDRTAWIVLNALGMLFCVVLPIAYLLAIRPQLRAVERGRASD